MKELSPFDYIPIAMIGIVFALSVFQAFQINALQKEALLSPNIGNGITMEGWTEDEKMMYEHHGTLPARLQGKNTNLPPSTGMVGGC